MALNDNIVFSSTNLVENADISCSVETVTPLDWMKTSRRSRQTRWVNPAEILSIHFRFDEPHNLNYFAIPGHDLPEDARVRFISYDADNNIIDSTGYQTVGSLIPAGQYVAGSDRWNTTAGALSNNLFFPVDLVLDVDRILLQIEHNYTYVEPTEGTTTVTEGDTTTETVVTSTPNGIFQQDAGVVCVEAESAEMIPAGSDSFDQIADTSASDDKTMEKSGSQFYWSALSGPQLKFNLKATQSGSHKIWLRVKLQSGGNSLYTSFDGQHKTNIFNGFGSSYEWRETSTVNLVAESVHEVVVSARDYDMTIDKIVVQPNGNAAPTGDGPDESDTGVTYITTTETTTGEDVVTVTEAETPDNLNSINIRAVMAGELLQLRENFEAGFRSSFVTEPETLQTESGYSVSAKTQKNVRQMSFNLAVMDETDRRTLIELQEDMNGKAFMVSAYPNASEWVADKHMFLAKFNTPLQISDDNNKIYSTVVDLIEV